MSILLKLKLFRNFEIVEIKSNNLSYINDFAGWYIIIYENLIQVLFYYYRTMK